MNSLKILSLKMAKIEKEFPILKKLIIWLFKYIKTKSPLPFLGKLGYFLHFWVEKRWASQVKCSQSKFKTAYSTQILFPVLRLQVPSDISDKFDPSFCKFGCSSGDHVRICERKWSIVPDAKFNPEWIGTNIKSQKWKTKKLVCPFLLALFHFETHLINGFLFISDNCGQFGNFFQLSLK